MEAFPDLHGLHGFAPAPKLSISRCRRSNDKCPDQIRPGRGMDLNSQERTRSGSFLPTWVPSSFPGGARVGSPALFMGLKMTDLLGSPNESQGHCLVLPKLPSGDGSSMVRQQWLIDGSFSMGKQASSKWCYSMVNNGTQWIVMVKQWIIMVKQ